jgi:succinate dehydrogenase / fumarate reductase iron-sulfur subunit
MEKGKVTVFRYNPERDKRPYYQTHEFPFESGMSVLDVAMYVYTNIDGTFSFDYCCRNSHCGLCGVRINGKPGLMCRESASREMTLEPLENINVIRDLVIDRDYYEERMSSLRLFLDRVHVPATHEPETVKREFLDRFKVVSRCVKCYNCLSVCPAFRDNCHQFIGPAGLVLLSRHVFDPRDELNREIIAFGAGIFECTLCGKCAAVCPHGISPKEQIETLRERLTPGGDKEIAQG